MKKYWIKTCKKFFEKKIDIKYPRFKFLCNSEHFSVFYLTLPKKDIFDHIWAKKASKTSKFQNLEKNYIFHRKIKYYVLKRSRTLQNAKQNFKRSRGTGGGLESSPPVQRYFGLFRYHARKLLAQKGFKS